MTYSELKQALDRCRASAQRMTMLSQRVRENVQVSQRLTAMYGKERVQSGGVFEDPTLAAMIRADEWADEFRDELEQATASLNEGKALVARMKSGPRKDTMINYYVLGWSHGKIARLQNWRSKSSVRRTLCEGINELYNLCK